MCSPIFKLFKNKNMVAVVVETEIVAIAMAETEIVEEVVAAVAVLMALVETDIVEEVVAAAAKTEMAVVAVYRPCPSR